MRISQILFVASVLVAFSGTCCKKDNPGPQLPPISTTGACILGSRVNGEVWLPGKKSNGTIDDLEGGLLVRWNPDGNEDTLSYDVLLFCKGKYGDGFQIYSEAISDTGYYRFGYPGGIWPSCSQCDSDGYFNYRRKRYTSGNFKRNYDRFLRFDKKHKIYSGVFSFTAFSSDYRDTIQVTDLRFDIDMNKIIKL